MKSNGSQDRWTFDGCGSGTAKMTIPMGHLFKGNTEATNHLIDVKCNSETNPMKFFRGSKKRRSVLKLKS